MNYQHASTSHLYCIAYHENCNPVDRVLALQELIKRKKQTYSHSQASIKRKLNN